MADRPSQSGSRASEIATRVCVSESAWTDWGWVTSVMPRVSVAACRSFASTTVLDTVFIYYGQVGKHVVLLLCGGTKQSQSRDIDQAQQYWRDYRNRSS